jgi:hypothetical protein
VGKPAFALKWRHPDARIERETNTFAQAFVSGCGFLPGIRSLDTRVR